MARVAWSTAGRRGQAALEFLSTYGFAFIALLITLGAISYFGIFNPATLRSDDCFFPPGVTCLDFIINRADPSAFPAGFPALPAGSAPYLRLSVYNAYGVNMSVTSIQMNLAKVPGTATCSMVPAGAPAGTWASATNITIWCPVSANFITATRYDGAVSLNFTQSGGAYTHSIKGLVSITSQ